MKVSIDAKDTVEAQAIRRAMKDPMTRAVVLVMGTLLQLPTDRLRARVLGYARDRIEDEAKSGVSSS